MEVNKEHLKQALLGHHLLMKNISIFHLLLPIVALSTGYTLVILIISLGASLIFASIIFKGAKDTANIRFVAAHWQMAWKRTRYLLISYVISACVMGLGGLLASLSADPQMEKILLTTFIPMATLPTLLMVIIVLVLETMTTSRAKQGLEPNNKF